MVWCLLIDHENEPIGSFFEVATISKNIAHLKQKVKSMNQLVVQSAEAHQLVVWRCEKGTVLNDTNKRDEIRRLFSNGGVEMLDSKTAITKLKVLKNETLLLQIPGVFSPSSINRAILTSVARNHT
jgi:hypothetical protein